LPDSSRGRPPRAGRNPGALACGLLLLGLIVAAAPVAADSRSEYDEAASTILCDCGCHPQSVADCTCGRAAEMRSEIQGLVAGGMTGDAVIASYVERYGDKIRIAPTAKGFNLLAWLGPLGALVIGAVGVAWLARRLSRAGGASAEPPAPPATPPADEAYLARLRQEVEERL